MESETADILGQPHLPLMEKIPSKSSFSTVKWFLVLVVLFVGYSIVMRIRQKILLWREKSYKLATRRKHGIPDHDRRPFNVAYAAAMLARDEREKNERNRMRRQLPSKPVQETTSVDRRESHADQALKHRTDRFRSSGSLALPGAYTLTPGPISSPAKHAARREPSPYSSARPGFADPQRLRKSTAPLYNDHQIGNSRHAARNIVDLSSEGDARKRGLDEQDFEDDEPTKKTRIEGDEFIDGDEEVNWDDYETALSHQRGSKRGLRMENNSDNGRDKRARKVSLDKSEKNGYVDEDMDIDGELDDELPDLHFPVRGKKRDRAEAGSTFGGDDDDSSPEDEKLRRRRRKRRTVAQRKSDAALLLNGKKRDREIDVDDEELDNTSTPGRGRHHKKGKRHTNIHRHDEEKEISDISVDESLASSTRSRGRKIGEEWESNGVRYKVAPNGQRLQQALVKKARHKFVMPQDSVHPDRDENLEVYVETWLTEDEFLDAKERMLLAWQDSPKQSVEPENLSVNIPAPKQAPPVPVGKNLLWKSTVSAPNTSPSDSPLDGPGTLPMFRPKGLRNPGRYSLGTHIGLRNNPFEKQSSISTKRIVSASIVNQSLNGSPGLSDSTNSTVRPRTLSKWERQEIEANAICKLRAARQAEIDAKAREEKEKADKLEKEKQERERQERERQEKERQERERQEQARLERERLEREKKEKEAAAAAAAAAAAVPKVPTITVTQPSGEIKPPASSGFSFSPSTTASAPAPAPAPATDAKAEAIKMTFFAPQVARTTSSTTPATTTAPAPQNLFSFKNPVAPASATTPTTQPTSAFSFAGNPAAPATTSTFPFQPTPASSGGLMSASTAAASQPSVTPAAPAPAPKFNFFGTPGESGDSSSKPAASCFSFGTSRVATGAGAEPGKTVNGAVSQFSGTAFGPTPSSSSSSLKNALGTGITFGGSQFGTSSNANAPAAGSTASSGAFSFGGQDKGKEAANGTKSSTFGGFGGAASGTSTSGGSVFGGGAPDGSVFGSKPAEPAATSTTQPVFSFGGGGPSGGSSLSGGTEALLGVQTPKSKFPFGPVAGGSTTTPAGTPTTTNGAGGGFSFTFNKPAAAGAANTGKSTFGGGSQPLSAFGFGTPTAAGVNATVTTTTPAGTPGFMFGGK